LRRTLFVLSANRNLKLTRQSTGKYAGRLAHSDFALVAVMLVLVAMVAIPVVVPMEMMVPVVMPTIMIPMSMPALDTMHYAAGDALAWIPLCQAGAPVASMIPAEAANKMIFLSITGDVKGSGGMPERLTNLPFALSVALHVLEHAMGVQEGNFADSKFLSLNLARRWITLTEQFTLEHCPGSSKLAEQNQDQHDNEYEAEPAATVVAGAVEGAAPEPAKAPE
jgi:hypothetical protein